MNQYDWNQNPMNILAQTAGVGSNEYVDHPEGTFQAEVTGITHKYIENAGVDSWRINLKTKSGTCSCEIRDFSQSDQMRMVQGSPGFDPALAEKAIKRVRYVRQIFSDLGILTANELETTPWRNPEGPNYGVIDQLGRLKGSSCTAKVTHSKQQKRDGSGMMTFVNVFINAAQPGMDQPSSPAPQTNAFQPPPQQAPHPAQAPNYAAATQQQPASQPIDDVPF